MFSLSSLEHEISNGDRSVSSMGETEGGVNGDLGAAGSEQQSDNIVDASPTKDFFISMLVKDIGLTRAIIDLVDNSVDGARRTREGGDFSGLEVRIQTSPEHFQISDTCGGMSIELARKYAFRFGRPEQEPRVAHSVGQFGVGMKRALFKLGKKFIVQSTTRVSRFVIEEDVDQWRAKEEWEFTFKSLQTGLDVPEPEQGTVIRVEILHKQVADEFRQEKFKSQLYKELRDALVDSVNRGLTITLNSIPLQAYALVLLLSPEIRPAYEEMLAPSTPEVSVKLYAGLEKSDPSAAGWYVFCNGRLVLGADQSRTTGWGEDGLKTIPKFHNQYARFRGYVFLESDNSALLP
ncbi:MAG TPA: ATP-binding protein, partial [Blastocatellia bacterium]|nr:ATP-binding protein [Blastocatellia bacterium]